MVNTSLSTADYSYSARNETGDYSVKLSSSTSSYQIKISSPSTVERVSSSSKEESINSAISKMILNYDKEIDNYNNEISEIKDFLYTIDTQKELANQIEEENEKFQRVDAQIENLEKKQKTDPNINKKYYRKLCNKYNRLYDNINYMIDEFNYIFTKSKSYNIQNLSSEYKLKQNKLDELDTKRIEAVQKRYLLQKIKKDVNDNESQKLNKTNAEENVNNVHIKFAKTIKARQIIDETQDSDGNFVTTYTDRSEKLNGRKPQSKVEHKL